MSLNIYDSLILGFAMDVWSFGVSEGLRDRTVLIIEVHTPSAHLQKAQINSVVCLYVVDWSHCRTGPYNFLGKGGRPWRFKEGTFDLSTELLCLEIIKTSCTIRLTVQVFVKC